MCKIKQPLNNPFYSKKGAFPFSLFTIRQGVKKTSTFARTFKEARDG